MLVNTIISFSVVILFSITLMGFLLYRRWNKFNYLIFTGAALLGFLSHLALLINAYFSLGDTYLRRTSTLSLFVEATMLLLFIGLYFIYQPLNKKRLIYFVFSPGALALLMLIDAFIGSPLIQLLSSIIAIGSLIAFYFLFISDMRKRKLFLYLGSTIAATSLLLFIDAFVQSTFLKYTFFSFILIFNFQMMYVFFSRIVDLIHIASYQSVTDGLTGLYYKDYFQGRLIEASSRNESISLFFIDIDHFKKVNDTQGHPVGDQILKLTARILKQMTEELAAVPARYGGEELVLMVTDPNIVPLSFAETYRQRVQDESAEICPVTVSIGIATSKEGNVPAEELIHRADQALYHAKKTGRNKVVHFKELQDYSDVDWPAENDITDSETEDIEHQVCELFNEPTSEINLVEEMEPQEAAEESRDQEVPEKHESSDFEIRDSKKIKITKNPFK